MGVFFLFIYFERGGGVLILPACNTWHIILSCVAQCRSSFLSLKFVAILQSEILFDALSKSKREKKYIKLDFTSDFKIFGRNWQEMKNFKFDRSTEHEEVIMTFTVSCCNYQDKFLIINLIIFSHLVSL